MNARQANSILSVLGIAQNVLDYKAANREAVQTELQARWDRVEATLEQTELSYRYLAAANEYKARAKQMGHGGIDSTNIDETLYYKAKEVETEKRRIHLRANAQIAQRGLVAANQRFDADVQLGINSAAALIDSVNRKVELDKLEKGEDYKPFKRKTKVEK